MPQQPKNAISIGVGLILVAASLGIGIWLLMGDDSHPKAVSQSAIPIVPTTTDASTTSKIEAPKFWADPAAANWDKKFFNLKSPDGFRKTSENSWSIKGGRLFMQVHREKTGKLVVRFVYPFEEMMPKDTIAMLRARWTPWETHKLVDELGISAAQFEALMAVDPGTDAPVSGRDRQAAIALFKEAVAAFDKNETVNGGLPTVPEEKLTDAVRDLDQKYYDATFDKTNKIAAEVKAIFTETQYAGLMRRFGTW